MLVVRVAVPAAGPVPALMLALVPMPMVVVLLALLKPGPRLVQAAPRCCSVSRTRHQLPQGEWQGEREESVEGLVLRVRINCRGNDAP